MPRLAFHNVIMRHFRIYRILVELWECGEESLHAPQLFEVLGDIH